MKFLNWVRNNKLSTGLFILLLYLEMQIPAPKCDCTKMCNPAK